MSKKAVIVTPFDNYSYNVRVKYIERCLASLGYDVLVLSADFDHRKKCHYDAHRENLELLHVPEYKSNLSYQRMYSHYCFAKVVYQRVKEINPDFIYGSTPPNFLVKFLSKYKKECPSVKLVFEVGDLWPETLPLSGKLKMIAAPAMGVWRRLRDNYIAKGDGLICECDLFKKVIGRHATIDNAQTIYLCKEDQWSDAFAPTEINDTLNFAYVGSINNIIDIDLIVNFLVAVQQKKKVHFDIIGGGENAERLLELCDSANINYQNHGIVYDEKEKCNILGKCQFAFNIMKTSVVVGATMKSLEYFHSGLILINNITSDTADIINRYECGYNLQILGLEEAVKKVINLTKEDIYKKQIASRKVFNDLFDERVVTRQFTQYIKKICERF